MSFIDETNPIDPLTKCVSDQKAKIRFSKNQRKRIFGDLFNDVWNNPNFKPVEIITSWGTDAASLFMYSAQEQAILNSVEPGCCPQIPSMKVTLNQDGTVTLSDLAAVSINPIDDVTVALGVTDPGLPTKATVVYENGYSKKVDVTWDTGTPTFDGTTAGTYAFTGTAEGLTISLNVIVA